VGGSSGRVRNLAARDCVPCAAGTPPLAHERLVELEAELGNDWTVVDAHHLEKEFEFEDFASALSFTNRVGELAEEVNHHPDIELSWGRVKLSIWTHTVGGLSESDFVWAARAQALR